MNDGYDEPKEIVVGDVRTHFQDAITDYIHVMADERGTAELGHDHMGNYPSLDSMLFVIGVELSNVIGSAYHHFEAEREGDDLCPEGVKLVFADADTAEED